MPSIDRQPFISALDLPRPRSALVVATAAYADAQLARLRSPAGGVDDLVSVLGNPEIGGFAVTTLTDPTEAEMRLGITRFLATRTPDETVLLYLSCHAIRGRMHLYLAAADTLLGSPLALAVRMADVLAELGRCPARRRILILDCCFSGGSAGEEAGLDLEYEFALARGIAVLSGSRTREYWHAGRPVNGVTPGSAFTAGLAEGLTTGAADAAGNGLITVADAYNYAYQYVTESGTGQLPQHYLYGSEAEIVLARVKAGVPARAPGPSLAPAQALVPPQAPAPARGGGRARHESPGTARSPLEQDRDDAYCVAFSPDGRLLASGGWGRPVRVREVATGGLVRELRVLGPSAYDVAFSPDGRLLATAGRDGSVGLCELARGKKIRKRKPCDDVAVRAVAFSPGGALLASGHADGVVRVWEASGLNRLRELRKNAETIFDLAFSPDGTLIATACGDGAVRVWHATSGALVSALRCHTGWATGVAFSRDGAMVTSSGADGAVALHEVGSGTYVHVLRSEGGIVNAMAISPDGALLAAAYENGTIAVWELATGGHEFWRVHAGFVTDVVFSPGEQLLASAGKDGTVRLWR